jgi:hypothetical protein
MALAEVAAAAALVALSEEEIGQQKKAFKITIEFRS